MSHRRVSRVNNRVLATCIEPLELRRLLTSTLYIDYGDRFPGGLLNTTVGAIDDTTSGGNPNIDGPRLSDPSDADYGDSATVAITSLNTLYGASAAALRASWNAIVQRYYEAFDITVVDLTANFQTVNGHQVRAAASLAEVSQTLGINEGDAKNNDSYVIVGRHVVNGTDNPSGRYGGISTGTDIGGNNNNDGTALVLLSGSGDGVMFNGDQIAHEAGHAFGLRHVYRQNTGSPAPAISNTSATGAQYDRLHQSELMSYLGYGSLGFDAFSRYPTMRGDGNTDANTLSSSPTIYNQFINDSTIGPSGIEYVTGTGANDIITITSAGGGLANVSIQAFDDAGYTTPVDAPGATGNTYSYTISLAKPLVIDAVGRNDRIVLDGDLGNSITVRGSHGTDTLIINGKNAASAVYTSGTNNTNGLDGNTDLRGSISIGGTTVSFQEFESAGSVTVQNVANLTFRTGGSNDTVLFNSTAPGQNRISGTSGGVAIVPLLFTNVTGFTIDTGTNDGASAGDVVTLSTNALATGLQTISVNTGAGNDRLDVDFAPSNPVPSSGLNYNGGTGTDDVLALRGGTFAAETYNATGPGSGNINLDGSVINYSNLSPITDTNVAAALHFNATGGADAITISNGPVVNTFQTNRISSGGTFERLDFANKAAVDINGLGGADAFNLAATTPADGLATLALNGQSVTNVGDDAAADTFTIDFTPAGVAVSATGGGGADVFTIAGSGLASGSTLSVAGQDGDDLFNATSSAVVAINVDGGAHVLGDRLNVDGEALDYTIGAATFTTSGRQPINYVAVETLGITNGTFNVPGVIAPNVEVGQDAKLYGVGTVQGNVTAVDNGIVSPGTTLGGDTGILNTGSVAFASTASFQVQLNGLADGTEHDVLNVTGTVALNGANLDALAGFTAVPGDEIMIIHNDGADGIVGKFVQGDMITIGAQKFAIDYAYDGDGDGNFNDVALIRYGAALAPDPCDPTKQALFVSATTGPDTIRFVSLQGNKTIEVLINGTSEGIFQPTGLLIGFGQSGDDVITVEVPSRPSWLYGQVGNDRLVAGNNDSIMLGGWGDDTAIGGNGRDILIGGRGSDLLNAGTGDDALIGGYTLYDNNNAANRAALCAIFDEWTGGTGGWKGRIDHLTNGGGKNGAVVLTAASVFDDGVTDRLNGDTGKDWFLARLTGVGSDILDADKNEIATSI